FSARPSARCAASATSTLATPAICLAASATADAPLPITSTCTSPPILPAAATAFRVAPFSSLLSCSAITRDVMSDHLRFVFQFVDQRGHIRHLDACLAAGRLGNFQRLQARGHVNAELFGLDIVQRLFLRLHDVGQ